MGGGGRGGEETREGGKRREDDKETAGELGIWILQIRLANRNRKIKKTGVKIKQV